MRCRKYGEQKNVEKKWKTMTSNTSHETNIFNYTVKRKVKRVKVK